MRNTKAIAMIVLMIASIGAELFGADLGYANLTGANMTGANLDGVRWINTTCPDGTNSDDNGNTCENNL